MPIPVNFKGLAIIEYPDDWTEEMIREDARKNEREITAKITKALREQAIAETAEDPENQPSGFLEHLGDAGWGVVESAGRTIASIPKHAGRTMEILGPEAFSQDPNLGGSYIPPETQKLWDELHRQRAAEDPETMRERIEGNMLVKAGKALEETIQESVPSLPGRESRFWSGQVPQGLGTTVAGVAATLAGGPMAGAGMMFSAEAEDAWESELARQTEAGEPYNPDKALLKAFGYGAFASAVESGLGVGRLSRKLRQAFGGSTKEAVQKAAEGGKLGKFLADVVKEGAAGFTEEAVQRIGQGLIVSGEIEIPEAVQEGTVGAVVQSGLGAPASAREAFRSRRAAPALPETARAVQETQARAGAAGVIKEPEPLTEADLAEIEGVEEAAAKQAAPDETKPAVPPLPVAEAGRASGNPEPEALPSLLEQIRLTEDPASSKAATLVTTGTEIPDFDSDVLLTVKTKHGIVIFNPDKIGPDEIQEAAKGDVFDGRVLGMADSGKKPTSSPVAVTTSTPAARNVVTELVEPTEEAIAKATEAQQAAVPGGTTEVKPAAQIIAERREDREANPTPTPARLMSPDEYLASIQAANAAGGMTGPVRDATTGQTVEAGDVLAGAPGAQISPIDAAQRLANAKRAMRVHLNAAVRMGLPINRASADEILGGPPEGYGRATEDGLEVYAPMLRAPKPVRTEAPSVPPAAEPISETPQPATPQQAPAGVVEPAPGGVVAPPVTSSTDETGRSEPNPPGTPAATQTGEGTAPRPKGAVQPVRPKPRDDGGKPGAQPSTQPKGGDQSALQAKEGEQAPVAPAAPRPAPETMPKTPAPAITKKEREDEDRGEQGQPVEGAPPMDAGEQAGGDAGDAQERQPGTVLGQEAPGGPPAGGQPEGRWDDRGRSVRGRQPVDSGTDSGGGSGSGATAVAGPGEGDSPVPVSADPVLNQNPPPSVPDPPKKKDRNHVLPRDQDWIPTGAKTRARANIAAIKLLKAIEASGRNATPEEKETLAKYVGWGALPQAFDLAQQTAFENAGKGYWTAPDKLERAKKWRKDWGDIYDELKSLLTPAEYQDAKESTINAHYTSRTVINGLWDIVRKAGFQGGRVLEPATGVGNIVGLMPADLAERTHWDGSELDSITSRLASKIYPEMRVQQTGFERTKFKRAMFDLAISNVPFAKAGPKNDPRYPQLSLHNYFFARALDLVKPGGLVVFITSDSTMDAPISREAREYINQHADLVGAIRLPNDAFKDAAGTEVTTDIIVLRRRDGTPFQGQEWIRTVDAQTHDGKPTIVNEYYAQHPEMLLGKLSLEGTMYGGGDQRALVPIPGADLVKQISDAVGKLPSGYFGAQSIPGDVQAEPEAENANAKLGQLAVRGGSVVQNVDGKWEAPEWSNKPNAVKQAKEYIALRDVYLELIRLQNQEESSEEQISAARSKLNQLYDQYAGKYGRVNARSSAWLEDDVDFYTVLAMEDPDTQSEKVGGRTVLKTVWKKAPIFERRTIFPRTPPTRAQNAKDAVSVSINFRGALDLAFVAELLGTDQATAQKRAIEEDAAFLNPKTGLLETPASYLSGNVRKKLDDATIAAEEDPEFNRNVDALTKIQPPTIPIERIGVRLGAQWIPPGAILEFARETLGVELEVELVPGTSRWVVNGAVGKDNADNTVKYGIHGWTGSDMVLAALNLKHPTVTKMENRTDANGKPYQAEVKDVPKSLEAQEKQQVLKRLFTTWAKQSEKWAPAIQQQFNYAVNGSVWPRFDAATWSHFPGASTDITLRQHQKEVVARMIQNSTLLAHAVGTGKTYAIITAAMEMRRIGTAKKPMIVVQNATLEQFARSFRRLYPSARILVPNSKQRTSKHRNSTMSRIATGDWDAVIVPQSFVNLLPDDPAREAKYVQDRIDKLEINQIQAAASGGKNSPTVKEMVKAVKKLKERLADLQSRKKDKGLTFEQLGVDALFVDEAHAYKKLEFETQKENIKGLDKGASQRGLSMLMKVRWVQERNQGKNVIFATGTPVSNTIAESWTMMRFLRPDVLRDNNVEEFDQFDTTFGESVVKWEMQPGGTYKQVERYAKFTNGVPLITMWRTVADVKTSADVNLPGIPAVKGGSRRSVAMPRTQNLEKFVGVLLNRLRTFEAMSGKERRLHSYIPVVAFGEAKKATLDMRLINPSLPDEPGSKLNRAVKEVLRIYKESRDVSGAQMVFSDAIEMEKDGVKFNAHQEIRRKLIEGGIPADKVVVIDAGIKDEKRDQVFAQLNAGEIAVAIGSSERMGVGVNAQEHLIALHHLDAPHRPMDIEQREGRILRQGNSNPVVELLVYGVEKTLDSALFERLLTKQTFINQILTGDLAGDEFEDAANEATMAFQEQMASFSGDPLVLEKFVLTNELQQLVDLKEGHNAQIRQSRSEIKRLEGSGIPAAEREVSDSTKQAAETERLFSTPPFKWSVNGTEMDQKEAIPAVDKIMSAFAASARKRFEGVVVNANAWETPSTILEGHAITVSGREVQVAVRFPLDTAGVLKPGGTPEFIYQLKGEQLNWHEFSSATGLAMCLRNRVDRDKARLQQSKDDLSARQRDLRQLQEFVKGTFPKEDEILAKTKRLGEIERELQTRKAEPAPGETELRFGVTAEGQGFFFVTAPRKAPKSLGRRRMQAQRILAQQEKLAAEWEEIASDPAAVMPPGLHLDWIPSLQAAIKVLEEAMLEKAKTGQTERLSTAPGTAPASKEKSDVAALQKVVDELGIDADVVWEPGWHTFTPDGQRVPVAARPAAGGRRMQLNAAVMGGMTAKRVQEIAAHEAVHPELATAWGVAQLGLFELSPAQVKELQARGYTQEPGESDADYSIRLKDEFVARQAEQKTSWWRALLDKIRVFLAKVGLAKRTPEEVAREILRGIERRRADRLAAPPAAPAPAVPRYSTLPETPAAPIEPRPPRGTRAQLGKAPPKKDPVRSLPMTAAGVPIQPGGRRSPSTAEFGAPAYVRQKERERAIFAENFIAGHGTLKDAAGALNSIEDSALLAVTAGEILARAAESLQDPASIGATDPIDAARVIERTMALVQAIKTDTAQGMQAQNQVNARIGPFRAVLSYLELIRTQQQRVLGKKFPTVASDNIRDWMRESARKAVEAVARSMKSPDNVVTKALRRLAVEAEIPWAALFQSSWKTQRDVQVGLYKALRSNPDLAKLSKPEVIELTNLFVAAWAREHDIVFQREFARVLGESGVAEPDIARAARALPRIVRWLNLGILDEQRFREAVAPEFGVGSLDDADVIRLGELAQEAQRTPDGVRRNKVYQRMVDIMVASQGISTYDLAKDFWFANILSGLRTWVDVGVGSWVAAFTMTARAAADMTIRGRPKTAYRLLSTLIRATGEGLANAADIIATGDTSRLPDTTQRLWDQLHGKGRVDTLEAAKRAGSGWQRVIGQAAYVRRIMIALDYVGQLGARDAMLLYSAHARNDLEAIAAAERRFDKAETDRARAQARAEMGPKAKKVDVQAREREILEEGIAQDIRDSATVLGKVAALNADPVGWGGIMYRAISHMPWIVRAPLGLSFARAAINMAQNASDWLPGAGLVNYARSQVAGTDWFQGLPERHPFRLFGLSVPVERSRLILAAQIGGFVLTAAAMGLFLDDDDDDRPFEISGTWFGLSPAKKSQLMSTGERPLSLRVGDKWISFKNTPFASALAFVGNLRDKQRFRGDQFSEESAMERLVNAWLLGALYIKDVSAMSQLSTILGAAATDTRDELEDANKKLASTLGNTLAGFVPGVSLLREIDTITHGEVYRPNGGMEAWLRNIPFARRTIGTGPAVNALGDDIEAPRMPWGRWISEQPDDAEWSTVARLANRGVFLPVPGKTALIVGRDGARRQMTAAEYAQYAREAGKLWREEIRSARDFLRSADADEARAWFERRSDRLHRRARAGIRVTE